MGRLHDRMAEDLRLRNFSPTTQRNYLFYARRFAALFICSPEVDWCRLWFGNRERRRRSLARRLLGRRVPLAGLTVASG
jgi:hypothetical protein